MFRLRSKLVRSFKPVKVADDNKNTNLLHNMSIFRKLPIRDVL